MLCIWFCFSFFLFLFFFTEQTEPFQKPVSLEQHPDYAEYIFHPMDLCTLEKVTLFFFNLHIKMVRTGCTKNHDDKNVKCRQLNVGMSRRKQQKPIKSYWVALWVSDLQLWGHIKYGNCRNKTTWENYSTQVKKNRYKTQIIKH